MTQHPRDKTMGAIMPWIAFAAIFAASYGILCLLRWTIGIEATTVVALVAGLTAGIALWWLP